MELQNNPSAIISVGDGSWYANGVTRMESSLNYHGFWGKTFLWKNELPPRSETHLENPYAFKIYAFNHAFLKGYTHVLWLDASLWAIRPVMDVFDFFNERGIFAFRSGYSCAETCSDKLLNWAGVTRDQAMDIPEMATGCVGLNIKNPDAKKVFNIWQTMMVDGLFRTNRVHDVNDSSDYRFKFGRQDQSCFSIALHMAGVNIEQTEYVSYYKKSGLPEKTTFLINGL